MKGTVDPAASSVTTGVPSFWLDAMKNHRRVAEFIEEQDCEALEHLVDVSVTTSDDCKSFKLVFSFSPNEFFTNAELTKTFFVPNLLNGSNLELEKVSAVRPSWNAYSMLATIDPVMAAATLPSCARLPYSV